MAATPRHSRRQGSTSVCLDDRALPDAEHYSSTRLPIAGQSSSTPRRQDFSVRVGKRASPPTVSPRTKCSSARAGADDTPGSPGIVEAPGPSLETTAPERDLRSRRPGSLMAVCCRSSSPATASRSVIGSAAPQFICEVAGAGAGSATAGEQSRRRRGRVLASLLTGAGGALGGVAFAGADRVARLLER
jgi:hypothetical protein